MKTGVIRNSFTALCKKMEAYPGLRHCILVCLRRTTMTINRWPEQKFINGVMDCYKRHMGYSFNLSHPVLFTEKLQWYKVYYQRDDFANITDKYLFKNYVKEKLGPGHTIPIYNVWTDIGDLERDWHSLPEEFVLKANLQSDGRNIMFVHHKSQTDFRRIRPELKRWLKVWDTLLNSWEWHFYNSTPRILAEKYMSNIEGQLYDYKIYCFDGEPYCMYVAQEHFVDNNSYPITFYDLDWKKIDVCYGSHRNADAAKPKHFAEMVEMARILSKGFPFIRVDFFDTDEKPYVAEMTFTPGGGCVPYSPESFNRLLGDKLILKSFSH